MYNSIAFIKSPQWNNHQYNPVIEHFINMVRSLGPFALHLCPYPRSWRLLSSCLSVSIPLSLPEIWYRSSLFITWPFCLGLFILQHASVLHCLLLLVVSHNRDMPYFLINLLAHRHSTSCWLKKWCYEHSCTSLWQVYCFWATGKYITYTQTFNVAKDK